MAESAKNIKVVFPHEVSYVDSAELNSLIQAGKILAFERQHRLVVVGLHPIRKTNMGRSSAERRNAA
jgi:hypothetical protein